MGLSMRLSFLNSVLRYHSSWLEFYCPSPQPLPLSPGPLVSAPLSWVTLWVTTECGQASQSQHLCGGALCLRGVPSS